MSIFDYAGREFLRFGIRNRLPLFDRSRRRFAAARDDESALEERAIPSSRTNTAMRTYFDAREGGDTASAWDAVRDAAMSWRADNNAGGLPVYGHLPLPRPFAAEVARDVNNVEEDRETALNDLLSRFDPGLAAHVKSQLDKSAPVDRPSGLGNGGAHALLATQKPGPIQQGKPPGWPPEPREKPPVSKAKEDARRALCEQIKHDYVQQQRAVNEADRKKQAAGRRVQELQTVRPRWLNEVADIEANLRAARSRSTEPGGQDIWVCPIDNDRERLPARERLREKEKQIQQGVCFLVDPIERWQNRDTHRRRLEREKAQDIRDLEAELKAAKQKLYDIDAQTAQAQQDLKEAKYDHDLVQRGLGPIFQRYEASCGDRSELLSIAPY